MLKLDRNENIQDVLVQNFRKFAGNVAFQELDDKGELVRYSYAWAGETAFMISSFIRSNYPKRSIIGVCAPNGPLWGPAFFGILLSDCVAVPIDIHSGAAEISHIVKDTGLVGIVTVSAYLDKFAGMPMKHAVLLNHLNGPKPEASFQIISLEEIKSAGKPTASVLRSKGTDTAVMLYTSGTTSQPKGVVITHGNILFDIFSLKEVLPIGENDNFLSVITLSHTFELCCGLFLPVFSGARITYSHSIKYTTIFTNLRVARPTIMLCVPFLLKILLEHLISKGTMKRGVSLREVEADETVRAKTILMTGALFGRTFRYLISGGAPLDTAILAGYRELGIELLQVYGLTETTGVSTLTPPGSNRNGSAGKPIPGVSLRIDTTDGGAKGDGEIFIAGGNLMKEYHRNAAGTREVLENGWLKTGDIGHLDAEGYLYITGRSKNVIVTAAGVNVHPEELEQRICKSPFVKDCCVIGKERPDRTETVHAVVVPDWDYYRKQISRLKGDIPSINTVLRAEIDAWTADLANYKRVLDFQVRTRDLPRGRTKKVARKVVKSESFSIDGRLGRIDKKPSGRPIALVNGTVVTPFRVAEKECVIIENGKITQLGRFDTVFLPPDAEVINVEGKLITPGFIDLHIHGSGGCFFNEATPDDMDRMIAFSVSHGTTCMLATLYVDERRKYLRSIASITGYIRQKRGWGVLEGIHLEGPFINKNMIGALNARYIWDASIDNWLTLKKAGKDRIKLMTIAPEIEGVRDIMQLAVQDGVILAVAHSEASYESVEVAIDNGLSQVTHIFNAMHPIHHRDPGVLTAALLKRELKVHLIADGFHVHPAVIELLYRLKGASGIILITDAINASGKPDGRYTMAGKEITVKNGKAFLPDGTLAGSTTTMEKSVATLVRTAGIPLDEAVRMGSLNPARVLGLDHRKGVLAAGKDADMVVMNSNFDVEMTIIGGAIVYDKERPA